MPYTAWPPWPFSVTACLHVVIQHSSVMQGRKEERDREGERKREREREITFE